MSFSLRVAQKAAEISDGNCNFKGALSIKITYETWGARLRNFSIFAQAALSSLLNKDTELLFYDKDIAEWTRGMNRQETNSGRNNPKS